VIKAPSAQLFRHEELFMFPLPTLSHVSPQDDHGFLSTRMWSHDFMPVKQYEIGESDKIITSN
jgi:hypothetical protein